MPAKPAPDASAYPGARFGMPRSGPGSMATFGRRAAAALVDWVLCQAFTVGVLGIPYAARGAEAFAVLGVFVLENLLLVSTTGSTIGHAVLGLRVGHIRQRPYPLQVLIRTLLLALFVPAVLTDGDGRGLHDRAAGTVIVRRR